METIRKRKRQLTKWEKVFANLILKLINKTNKQTNNPIK